MRVSFVIPHRKNLAMIQAAVRSIQHLVLRAGWDVETVLVDNASAEGAPAWAEAAGCRVLRLSTNQGFGKAVNQGIEASTGDWVVIMNDDVELAPDWLEQVQLSIAESPESWFACGKTLRHEASTQIDGVGDAICQGGTALRLGHGSADGEMFSVGRDTFFPSATATAFRRDFFHRAGLYDEMYFAYLEDLDLGLRAAMGGLNGIYVPQARAYHHGSRTGEVWSRRMVRWITGHQLLLLAKFFPTELLLRNIWNILVAHTLWAGLAMSRGQFVGWLQGVALALRMGRRARRNGRTLRTASSRFAKILADSEAEIKKFQSSTGFDSYWKWYFRLTDWHRRESA